MRNRLQMILIRALICIFLSALAIGALSALTAATILIVAGFTYAFTSNAVWLFSSSFSQCISLFGASILLLMIIFTIGFIIAGARD